jgi:hypothetical protein
MHAPSVRIQRLAKALMLSAFRLFAHHDGDLYSLASSLYKKGGCNSMARHRKSILEKKDITQIRP